MQDDELKRSAEKGGAPRKEPSLEEAGAKFMQERVMGGMENPFAPDPDKAAAKPAGPAAPEKPAQPDLQAMAAKAAIEDKPAQPDPQAAAAALSSKDKSIEAVAKNLQAKGQADLGKIAEAIEKPKEVPKELSALMKVKSFAIKPLRTFQGDAADAIQKQKASLLTIKLAEEKRRQETEKEKEPASYGIKAMSLVLSVLLILVGISTVFAFNYFTKLKKPTAPLFTTVVPYDTFREYNVTGKGREDLVREFAMERGSVATVRNGVRYVQMVEATPTGKAEISAQRFLEIMETKEPAFLARSLGETVMAGTLLTTKPEPFLVVKIASFDNAYSGMLQWEAALAQDLGPLFTGERISSRAGQSALRQTANANATGTAATGTPESAPEPQGRAGRFDDLLVRNLDTRVVRTETGSIGLLYSFVDKSTLVITSSEAALIGIVEKMNAAKLVR